MGIWNQSGLSQHDYEFWEIIIDLPAHSSSLSHNVRGQIQTCRDGRGLAVILYLDGSDL